MCEEIEFEIQEEDIPLTMNLEDDVYLVEPKTESLEVTPTKETQYFESETGIYYDNVTVNPIPDEYIIPNLGTKTITTNGTYNATDDNLDGYSQVSVETSGVDINEYFANTIVGGSSSIGGSNWSSTIKKLPPININGTNCAYMYCGFKGTEIDLSNFNMSLKLTNIYSMFQDCNNLTSLDLGNFNTINITSIADLFRNCLNLTNVNLSSFNTNKVKDFVRMFMNCQKLVELDLSSFYTPVLTSTQDMFYNCLSLKKLDIRNFDFTKVVSYSTMFYNVPTDCLIIVKDDTAKTWITSKFTTLTNVKTVAELEAA